jgi:drug/metabolite transporter (DMT)-like permease
VALRFAIASTVLLALVPAFRVKLGQSPVERRLWLANSLLTFAIPYSLLYWAEQWVPSGLAAVIFATFPLLTALLAHFVLPEERLTVGKMAGILVGFAGIAVIFSEDFQALGGPQVARAGAVMLVCPLSAACGGIAVKRWGNGVHPISIAAVPMGITALLLGPLAWLWESGREVTFDTPSVLALLYLAIIGSAVPFTLYFWLLKHQSATSISMINYATPVIAVAVGTLFLHEPFTPRILAGVALVVAGVAVAVRPKRVPAASPAQPSPAKPARER